MAFTTFLALQALLVGVAVVVLRPGAAALAARVVRAEVQASDLRLMGGTVAAAAGVAVLGVLVLNGPGRALLMLAVSAAAAVAALLLARWLDRPEVQRRLMRRLEHDLLRAQAAGRATGEHAGRVGREVTSRARRAGEERAARRR